MDASLALFEVVRDAALLSLDNFAIVTQTIALGMIVHCFKLNDTFTSGMLIA